MSVVSAYLSDPDPDPERKFNFCTINMFCLIIFITESLKLYLFIY